MKKKYNLINDDEHHDETKLFTFSIIKSLEIFFFPFLSNELDTMHPLYLQCIIRRKFEKGEILSILVIFIRGFIGKNAFIQ